jgi:hypothetical protein
VLLQKLEEWCILPERVLELEDGLDNACTPSNNRENRLFRTWQTQGVQIWSSSGPMGVGSLRKALSFLAQRSVQILMSFPWKWCHLDLVHKKR